jgi:4-hydroxy-tetrahydrodipicolinate synthase
MARFGEVITAMVTPFDDDLGLDLDGAVRLAEHLVAHGSDGLVLAGSTGEGSTITDAEQLDLAAAVAEAVTVPVIMGVGGNDTAHTVELAKAAAATGAAGVLAVTPYYNRPSQAGIDLHFRAVAAATELPVILYDIAIRTGRPIANDVLLGLARDVTNIVAVKDASGDVPQGARRVAAAPAGFEVYSGDDALTLPFLSVGGVGIISVAAHWAGEEMADMISSFFKGDVARAVELNNRLVESWEFEGGDLTPNPIPTKAMLRTMGLPAGQTRPPMGPCPDGLEDRARQVLQGLRG